MSVVVDVPGLPRDRRGALQAVVSHCTVKNTLESPPEITVVLGEGQEA